MAWTCPFKTRARPFPARLRECRSGALPLVAVREGLEVKPDVLWYVVRRGTPRARDGEGTRGGWLPEQYRTFFAFYRIIHHTKCPELKIYKTGRIISLQ
jgi:hypothetical protein